MTNASTAGKARGARPQSLRFSTILRTIAARPDERITLAKLTELFGDRAFGAILLIFALLSAVPLPPGSTLILGLPIMLVSWQLLIGRKILWLPAAVGNRTIRTSDLKFMVDKVLPTLRRTERLLAPRLSFIFTDVGIRFIGLICLVLAALIFLPIPFGNLLPGLSVAAFAFGLLRHDGLAVIVGIIVAIAAVIVLVAIYGAVFLSLKAFITRMFVGTP